MSTARISTPLTGSWLNLLPRWGLATAVTLALALAADHLGVRNLALFLALSSVALSWAAGWTARWAWQNRSALPRRLLNIRPPAAGRSTDPALAHELAARLPKEVLPTDYFRFMAWCSRLLRTAGGLLPIPDWMSPAVAGCWVTLLHQYGILHVAADGGSFYLSPGIQALRDVRDRISHAEFKRAVCRHVGLAQT